MNCYWCGKKAIHKFKNGKWCCSKNTSGCEYFKKKMSGKNNPRYKKDPWNKREKSQVYSAV